MDNPLVFLISSITFILSLCFMQEKLSSLARVKKSLVSRFFTQDCFILFSMCSFFAFICAEHNRCVTSCAQCPCCIYRAIKSVCVFLVGILLTNMASYSSATLKSKVKIKIVRNYFSTTVTVYYLDYKWIVALWQAPISIANSLTIQGIVKGLYSSLEFSALISVSVWRVISF